MKKKLLAVALVAAMAMGLMACGGGHGPHGMRRQQLIRQQRRSSR